MKIIIKYYCIVFLGACLLFIVSGTYTILLVCMCIYIYVFYYRVQVFVEVISFTTKFAREQFYLFCSIRFACYNPTACCLLH